MFDWFSLSGHHSEISANVYQCEIIVSCQIPPIVDVYL